MFRIDLKTFFRVNMEGNDMDTTVLEHFLVLSETLSITKAAERLSKSEPVLSRQISRLEEDLGLQLFIRTRSGLVLTPAGRIMRDAFSSAQSMVHDAYLKSIAVQSGKSGVITVGMVNSHMLSTEAQQFFSAFEEQHPNIELSFFSYSLPELGERLQTGQIDCVYSALIDFSDTSQYSLYKVEDLEPCLLVSPKHPALRKPKESLSLLDFKNDPILMYGNQPNIEEALTKLCASFGFKPIFQYVHDRVTMLTMVQFGKGIICCDQTSLLYSTSQMSVVSLPELGYLPLGLITSANSNNPVPNDLVQAAIEYYRKKHAKA